jgi:hypothetical protein
MLRSVFMLIMTRRTPTWLSLRALLAAALIDDRRRRQGAQGQAKAKAATKSAENPERHRAGDERDPHGTLPYVGCWKAMQ